MIYLDNAASTKVNEQIKTSLFKIYDEFFMNAHSPYADALKIKNLQEESRSKLAQLLKVDAKHLIFLASGSEANNMLIKGIAFKYLTIPNQQSSKKFHIITSMIEHSSVFETMKELELFGFEVTYLSPDENGHIKNEEILAALQDNTILISIMKVNSEIGTLNNLEAIYDEIKKFNPRIIVHSDCVQAFGKIKLNLSKLDAASFSAHKINGVKGSGLLYYNQQAQLLPLISGGEQEFGLRAGSSNYHFNIILAKTLRIFLENNDVQKTNDRFNYIYNLLNDHPDVIVNTPVDNCSQFILNFSLIGYKPEVIMNALENKNIYFSSKSACSSRAKQSRVMLSLPISQERQESALRISFDNNTSIEELKEFYQALVIVLKEVKKG